jgi:hypothetical protein
MRFQIEFIRLVPRRGGPIVVEMIIIPVAVAAANSCRSSST